MYVINSRVIKKEIRSLAFRRSDGVVSFLFLLILVINNKKNKLHLRLHFSDRSLSEIAPSFTSLSEIVPPIYMLIQ